jgi:hypothetical protein
MAAAAPMTTVSRRPAHVYGHRVVIRATRLPVRGAYFSVLTLVRGRARCHSSPGCGGATGFVRRGPDPIRAQGSILPRVPCPQRRLHIGTGCSRSCGSPSSSSCGGANGFVSRRPAVAGAEKLRSGVSVRSARRDDIRSSERLTAAGRPS